MLNTFLESLRFRCWIPQRMVYVTQITICGCDLESQYIISIFCNIQLVPLPPLTMKQLKGIKVLFDLITTVMLPYSTTGWSSVDLSALTQRCVEWELRGLMGFLSFSMFKDRELIEYMHSLIPLHHSCCDIHSVCTKKKKKVPIKNSQNAHLCTGPNACSAVPPWGRAPFLQLGTIKACKFTN